MGFEPMVFAVTQLQSILIFFSFVHFMITSFFYRDYTRPDLPSGPNESPFAGADIAGLAALGKQMLFFRLFAKMYMTVHTSITLLNFYCHLFLFFSYCSYICCVHNVYCDGQY